MPSGASHVSARAPLNFPASTLQLGVDLLESSIAPRCTHHKPRRSIETLLRTIPIDRAKRITNKQPARRYLSD